MLTTMFDLKFNIDFLKLLCYNKDNNLNLMELLISLTGFSEFFCVELECQKDFSYIRLFRMFRTCLEKYYLLQRMSKMKSLCKHCKTVIPLYLFQSFIVDEFTTINKSFWLVIANLAQVSRKCLCFLEVLAIATLQNIT